MHAPAHVAHVRSYGIRFGTLQYNWSETFIYSCVQLRLPATASC